MSVSLSPYLNFPGNAREAMTFYQSVFGGELAVSTFAEFGGGGGVLPDDGTMHAQLVHEGFTLMASDAMPGADKTWGGTRVYLAFFGDDLQSFQGWFDKLAEGGSVGQALEKQIWGDVYGLVMDKFGLEWMFNISQPDGASQQG